jgi:hypothetical protein
MHGKIISVGLANRGRQDLDDPENGRDFRHLVEQPLPRVRHSGQVVRRRG